MKQETCPMRLGRGHFRQDPYPTLAALRAECPAVPIEANGYRMWLITRYADARRLLGDPSLLKDVVEHRRRLAGQCALRPEKLAHIAHASRRSLLDRDGAAHRRLRAIVRNALSGKLGAKNRPTLRKIAGDLLDGLPLEQPVDLIQSYARPLCMTFICALYGIPKEDALAFPAWDNAMLTGSSIDEVESGGRKMHEFALRTIDYKRSRPADDVFTQLLRAHEAGALDADELASTFIVLMVSAGEVANAIGSGLLLLLSHPHHYTALKGNPSMLGKCVEEILRYESPFRLLPPRFSEQAVELDGVTIPAGELIVACPAATNRDPSLFADPERFEPARDASGHLAFGHGAHTCPGSRFARMEMEVALYSFIERFDACQLVVPREQARWRAGDFMRRLDELRVVLRS